MRVAPYAGAWIETSWQKIDFSVLGSPPTRGRGLKPADASAGHSAGLSPPTRGRGLKPSGGGGGTDDQVAPYAGAWIETSRTRSG